MNLASLKQLPPGVEEGNGLIAGLDECLLLGFARLGPAQHEAMERFFAAFQYSPLEAALREALDALKRSEFLAKRFCTIAAARTAIQGSQYDALLQSASEATGQKIEPGSETAASLPGEAGHAALLASTQQWLMELALAGFKNLSMETLAPFMATLEQLQAEPALARSAALLTGWLKELLAATPAGGVEIPVFRWADLWSRAMILAQEFPVPENGATVTGLFHPLGADVRTHPHFVSVVFYGLLEADGKGRIVRVPFSSYKVDVIGGMETWQLFRPRADVLLEALATWKTVQVDSMPLMPGGDLLWRGKAKLGAPFDPFALNPMGAPLPALPPLDRHPVQLAHLVFLEKCAVRASPETAALGRTQNGVSLETSVDDAILPLATERLTPGGELDGKTLESATAMIGLLRFDRGGWALQPLCVRTRAGKKDLILASGSRALEFCKKDKSRTLAILSERADKLLRQ